MPRPKKSRRVCAMPETSGFRPIGSAHAKRAAVTMTVDEFETVRLIDREGLNQEECAAQMEVARTTVQAIYLRARRKLADALVEGRALRIEGGEVAVCEHRATCSCHKTGCRCGCNSKKD